MPAAAHVRLVERVCRLIDAHLDEPLTLDDLGTAVAVSPAHLQRVFKRLMGISPRQYLAARRLDRFKNHLKEDSDVTTAIYEAGYGSASRVYERSAERLGMTPGTYRAGGQATAIRYTLTDCPLGRLLLAGTDRGVCAVYLGDADAPLEAELQREFPAAARARDDEGLSEWAEQVCLHLGGQPHLELPLDVRATAFQWRVWQQLRGIPRGQTRTYREVAEALGQPTAARAVARACATNPVSVVIPCHRVVRGDGGLGGYRWGLARKRKLLENEKGEPKS
jgi:AraC family transcriptional regulator of adaptative response/methylated-DNA-[protein]-cysteine methyltransferase